MEYTPASFFEARKRTIDATYGRLEKSETVAQEQKVDVVKSEEVEEPTAEEMAKADAEFDLMKSTEILDQPFDFTI